MPNPKRWILFLAVILTLSGLGIWAGSPRPTTPVGSWVNPEGFEAMIVSTDLHLTLKNEIHPSPLEEVPWQAYEMPDGGWVAVSPDPIPIELELQQEGRLLKGAKVYQVEEFGSMASFIVNGDRMSVYSVDGLSDLRRRTWFNSFEYWWRYESPWRSYRP